MSYDNDKDYSLEISENGKYIPISKISYYNIGKLCIKCINCIKWIWQIIVETIIIKCKI